MWLVLFPPPPPPTSYEHQFYGLTQDFTRLNMKTEYVCHGLICWLVNFNDNRTMQTVILIIKNCRRGAGGAKKSRDRFLWCRRGWSGCLFNHWEFFRTSKSRFTILRPSMSWFQLMHFFGLKRIFLEQQSMQQLQQSREYTSFIQTVRITISKFAMGISNYEIKCQNNFKNYT